VLVVVLVLENSDHFAISLAEQNSCKTSVYLRNRTEDEHDDEDEDDSKFRNLGLTGKPPSYSATPATPELLQLLTSSLARLVGALAVHDIA